MRHVHGGDIYGREEILDFSANMNPLGMPETIKQAAQTGVTASHQYPQPYARSLCEKIAAYESEKLRNHHNEHWGEENFISQEQVFAGNGAADLIFLLTRALQPEEGIVFTPSFAEYEAALRAASSTLSLIPLDEENGFSLTRHEIGSMRRHLAAKSDISIPGKTVVFVCQPGNPTGVLVEPEHLLELLEICRRFESWLVLDACFVPLLDEEQVHIQEELLAQCLEYERTIVLRAFTKAFAMPGLRLGYLVCRDTTFITRLKEVSQPWSVSIPAMMTGEAALKETAGFLPRSRAYINIEKQKLLEGLNSLPGKLVQQVYGHAANYIFFRAEPGLSDNLLKHGIMIRDCDNFTSLEPGYYRIAVRTAAENEVLLDTLRKIARECAARPDGKCGKVPLQSGFCLRRTSSPES